MRLALGSLFCCALAIAGCKKGDGIVLVSVTATSAAPVTAVTRLHVTATLDKQTKMFDVPTGGQPFDLPPAKTFGIDIPTALTGTLMLHVDAFGAASTTVPIASGDGMTQVAAGKRADLPVTLMPTGGGGGDGGVGDGAGDLSGVDLGPVVAPQLIAPLSTATVTQRRPTLRWRMGGGTPKVDLCLDRGCSSKLTGVDVTIGADGRSAVPNADLPAGVVFWRVEAIDGSTDLASPVWELFTGHPLASVAADTSNTQALDINGDGLTDLAVAASTAGAGKVHIFLGSTTGLTSQGATSQDLDSPSGLTAFGWSIAAAGDVNGDGFGDIIVSTQSGKVFVYLGSINGAHPLVPASVQEIDVPTEIGSSSGFGQVVAGAGDVNGDGYADVLVAAPTATVGGIDSVGRVYLFFGSASGVQPTVPAQVASVDGIDVMYSEFGDGIAGGDVNGDGYSDVIVGAPFGGSSMEGRVVVFLGGADGLSVNGVNRVIDFLGPIKAQTVFGNSLAVSDLNGDGYGDLVVGAYTATVGAVSNGGRVYFYLGSTSGPTPAVAASVFTADGTANNGGFGQAISAAGDLDGDGYSDLMISGSNSSVPAGEAFVYYGAASGGYRMPALTIPGSDGNTSNFGQAIAGIGDTDGDGYPDVAVSAPAYNSNGGRVHIYTGGAGGLAPATRASTIDGVDPAGSGFGDVIAWLIRKPDLGPYPRNAAAKS